MKVNDMQGIKSHIKCPVCKKYLSFISRNLFNCEHCNLEYAMTEEGLELYVGRFDYKLEDKYLPVSNFSREQLEEYRDKASKMKGGGRDEICACFGDN